MSRIRDIGLYIDMSDDIETTRNIPTRKRSFFVSGILPRRCHIPLSEVHMNIREFTKTYALFRDLNEAEALRIKNSSECRKYIQKNIKDADVKNLLKAMTVCIYDLTGDSVFRDQVLGGINDRFD